MSYCQGKDKATVRWNFAGEGEQIFTATKNQLPITVTTSESARVSKAFSRKFDGTILTSYGFSFDAPTGFSRKILAPKIYLLSGKWDDHGTIGSYNTGYALVTTYSGPPILIGSGYSVSGVVNNEIRSDCYVNFNLEWRGVGCQIEIFDKNNQRLLAHAGLCPIKFKVACDDECPEGYFRCESSGYPGYKCISCSEIQSQLAAMRNQVKRLRNG